MTDAVPLVQVERVEVTRGRRTVLHDIDLVLDAGVVAVLGPNGSGKSTLLQALATILPVHAGRIRIAGHDIGTWRGADQARRMLGYLPQEPTALENLTVVEACTYVAWLKLVARQQRADAVERVIDALSLREVRDRKLGQLSGGTRRRAHIAAALVHDPAVVMLDEPTSGLDPEHRAEVREVFAKVAPDRLVLFSTHLAEDLTPSTSRVLCLGEGRIAFDGTPQDIGEIGRRGRAAQGSDLAEGLRGLGGVQ
jgi:ABC-2 type transport system ATP-binding protein